MAAHDNSNDGVKKSNVFDFYGAKRRERRSDDGSPPEDPGYYAYGISITDSIKGSEEWLRIHGEIAGQYSSIDMLRYSDIVRVYCPVPELLCIMAEHVVYTLEGRHLDAITIHIQDRQLRALYLFDPVRYAEPNQDEPVIFRMEREDIGGEEKSSLGEPELPASN